MAGRRKKPGGDEGITREIPARLVSEDVIDRVVGLVVSIRSRADVLKACAEDEELQLSRADAQVAIDEAMRRINLAAAVDFDLELGKAKTRLAELFQHANVKDALAVQKELNKLLGLYPKKGAAAEPDAGDDAALEELAAARAHLAPLVDAGDDDPLDEIARRVVDLFTRQPAAVKANPPKKKPRK